MKKNIKTKNGAIDNFVNWQNKQYTPWSYVSDGNLLPNVEATGNPKLYAIMLFALSLISVVVGTIIVVGVCTTVSGHWFAGKETVEYIFKFDLQSCWMIIVSFGLLAMFYLFFGVKYWQKYKKYRKYKNTLHKQRRKCKPSRKHKLRGG